jgi:DNA-binding IscR family transcriptional regulator
MCAAATVWGRATQALRDVLGTTTLADLAQVQTSMAAGAATAER